MTHPITDRQRQVLIALVTTDGSDKAIGNAMGLSADTINSHLRLIFHKLGVHTRVQAAVWAIRKGLA
jgi:two-component system nitrate/nitrite response regulator NarL